MTRQSVNPDLSALRVIIPAAGIGARMNASLPKQYLTIGGISLMDLTLQRLREALGTIPFYVALHPSDHWWSQTRSAADSRIQTYTGGESRADSVRLGLDVLAPVAAEDDWVLVHDVARPCVTTTDIHRLLNELADHPVGGLLAAPVADTLKRTNLCGEVTATVDRGSLWRAYTPQLFRFGLLQRALAHAEQAGTAVTDEASAIEQLGLYPRILPGRSDNIKITVPEDMVLAEWLLSRQPDDAGPSDTTSTRSST